MKYHLDRISLLVTCDPEMSCEGLEAVLKKQGYTLGFFNPRYQKKSLTELLEKKPANLWALQYGELSHLCVALTLEGFDGKSYSNKRVPRTAAGPDFKMILIDSVGKKGRLGQVTLRVHPIPEHVIWNASYWPDLSEARSFLHDALTRHLPLGFARAYEAEQLPGGLRRKHDCCVVLRCAGLKEWIKATDSRLSALVRQRGGEPIRITKSKTVPALESLLRGGRS